MFEVDEAADWFLPFTLKRKQGSLFMYPSTCTFNPTVFLVAEVFHTRVS